MMVRLDLSFAVMSYSCSGDCKQVRFFSIEDDALGYQTARRS
jgi:hypothetical protein